LEKRHVCFKEDSLKPFSYTQLPCNLFVHKISHIPGILVEPKFHAALKNISCDLKENPFNSFRQRAITFNVGPKEVISKWP
jgi:hypothetical protein